MTNAEARSQELSAKLAETQADLDKRKASEAQLSDELRDEKKLLKESTTLCDRLKEDIAAANAKLEQAAQRHKDLLAENEGNKGFLADERKKTSALEAKLEDANSALEAAKRAADFQTKQYQDLEKTSDGVRTDLMAQAEALREELRQAESERAADAAKASAALQTANAQAADTVSSLQAQLGANMEVRDFLVASSTGLYRSIPSSRHWASLPFSWRRKRLRCRRRRTLLSWLPVLPLQICKCSGRSLGAHKTTRVIWTRLARS